MTTAETYQCPVCGWAKLRELPNHSHEICPCCGTQFGLDDYDKSYDELREEWYVCGAGWWSDRTPKPDGWCADEQLKAAGLVVKQTTYDAQ